MFMIVYFILIISLYASFVCCHNLISLNFPSNSCLCKENAQWSLGSRHLFSSIINQDEPSKQPVQIFLSEPIVICLPEVGDVNITIFGISIITYTLADFPNPCRNTGT